MINCLKNLKRKWKLSSIFRRYNCKMWDWDTCIKNIMECSKYSYSENSMQRCYNDLHTIVEERIASIERRQEHIEHIESLYNNIQYVGMRELNNEMPKLHLTTVGYV